MSTGRAAVSNTGQRIEIGVDLLGSLYNLIGRTRLEREDYGAALHGEALRRAVRTDLGEVLIREYAYAPPWSRLYARGRVPCSLKSVARAVVRVPATGHHDRLRLVIAGDMLGDCITLFLQSNKMASGRDASPGGADRAREELAAAWHSIRQRSGR